ncbi:Protease II, partial [hydrothermal vent metagenome]
MSSLLPPIADKNNHITSQHGISKTDPYHWLRADNWQEVMRDPALLDKKIGDYLREENAYFEARFGEKSKDLQETIYR